LKHGSGMGSASMPIKPGMALRRVVRRTQVTASFQCITDLRIYEIIAAVNYVLLKFTNVYIVNLMSNEG